jgi:hypothetical protein
MKLGLFYSSRALVALACAAVALKLFAPDIVPNPMMTEYLALTFGGLALLLLLLEPASPDRATETVAATVAAPAPDQIDELNQKLAAVVAERDRLKKKALDDEKLARERLATAGRDDVLGLLGLLQEKGRFLDFVMDDVAPYTDQQIGSAARVVHSGCSSVIREYFRIAPVLEGSEGAKATIDSDAESGRYRLLGKISGQPPFTGTVIHRGWQANEVKLPERVGAVSAASGVIAPAEIEIS